MHYKRLIALLFALAAITGLVACGGGNDYDLDLRRRTSATTAEAEPPTIVVRNGEPVAASKSSNTAPANRSEFKVESELADEVHVHGYDLDEGRSRRAGTVSFDFPAEHRRHLRGRARGPRGADRGAAGQPVS